MGISKRLNVSRMLGGGGSFGGKSRRGLFEVQWFFDKQKVIGQTDRQTRQVLSRFGAFVRRTAKKKIRRARQKKVDELSPEEMIRYRRAQRRFKQGKGPKPKRPLASSKPGEPPRSITGLLRDKILFWYSPAERSETIGPATLRAKGDIPGVLEHGGTTRLPNGETVEIEPRPYMGPSLEEELPKLPGMWTNSVRSST